MRFAVDSWAPEFGSSFESGPNEKAQPSVDASVEVPAARWGPRTPPAPPDGRTVLFTDGVRRVDARVWIMDELGAARPGICASYAAGAVLCDGRARIAATAVQRGLFTAAPGAGVIACKHACYPLRAAAGDGDDQLALALQQRMGELEVHLASSERADLIVIDGPLSGRQNVPGAVGFIKTHHVSYLPPELEPTIGNLAPGQRTPLFVTTTSWSRFSWYLRLPGASGHPWAGVARCEVSADNDVSTVGALADCVTALLPRFASEPHKDPRAPQNLYPIAGLERELKRRLGDALLLYRGLRGSASTTGSG